MAVTYCCGGPTIDTTYIKSICPYAIDFPITKQYPAERNINYVGCNCPILCKHVIRKFIGHCFKKCRIFQEYRKSGTKQLTTMQEKIALADCKEIDALYEIAVVEIENSDNEFMKTYLEQHIKLVEGRTDWINCAKSARRKLVVQMWEKSKHV
jgi:hypothetical protein